MAERDEPDRYEGFPPGFFERSDPGDDAVFYDQPRMVTHIDDGAIAAVGEIYRELDIGGRVLDLMGSWISHFADRPESLIVAGMNAAELSANEAAVGGVVADLNRHQCLPFEDRTFDGATCCVSVDYLVRPLEVFDEVARVLRPDSVFCITFSNRCFPTKVIDGWARSDDRAHVGIVAEYFRRSGPWTDPEATMAKRDRPGDPLYAVWARRP
jgi:SAM-dependent methyltransferase